MKIKINGIFGKYNNIVDLDSKCNIFIGENGVGKSTTMKIINTFLSGNFVDLLKYYFSSIEIIDNDKTKMIINYTDLIPRAEDILRITRRCDPNAEERMNPDLRVYGYDSGTVIKHFNDLMQIVEQNSDAYVHLLRTVLNEQTHFSIDGFKKQYNIDSGNVYDASYVLLAFYYNVLDILKYNEITYYDKTIFSDKEYYKEIDNLLEKYKKVFLISSVKELNITNDVYKIPYRYCCKNDEYRVLDSYKKLEKKLLEKIDKDIKNSTLFNKESIYIEVEAKERFYKELFDNYDLDLIIKNTLIDNVYKDYDVYLDLNGKYNDENKLNIDLQKLLFKNYYSQDVIMKFVSDYYTMLRKMIYREYTDEELDIDYILDDDDIYNKIIIFIEPLIPDHSFYRSFSCSSRDRYTYERKVFNKFIYDNLEFYVNYESEKIKILNELFEEYFKSKKIYCSPNGLIISDVKDFNNRYSMKYLSEGEMRIIIILVLTVLNENGVLLLDEPETSLSVMWQQRLVNDILENGMVEHLIISTQSPFIVDDDKLLDYVNCLPGDVINE